MRLPNYLRTYRKRSGLSQREVATLVGVSHGAQISRYERFTRIPPLPQAVALGVIFHVPVDTLFVGTIRTAEQDTARRLGRLVARLEAAAPSPARDRKLAVLRAARERT